MIPEAGDGGFTREEFLNLMETRLVALFAPLFPGREEDVVQAMSYYYSPWPHICDENFNRGMINNVRLIRSRQLINPNRFCSINVQK